jgi:hypothetical protein
MNTPDNAINIQGAKRSLDNPVTAAETAQDANTITPASSSSKKAKTNQDTDTSFRAWSSHVKETDTCTMYTLKCTFGDASKPINSYFKNQKVGFLRDECQKRGLHFNGKKADLLNRLQTELPTVTFEIDSREALQRVVNSMLYYFKWDNTHLFECEMPARGDMKTGIIKLWENFSDMGMAIRFGSVSPDPNMQDPYLKKRLAKLGITNEMIRRIQNDPDALGDVRKLSGSAFDPLTKSQSFIFDEFVEGSTLSLEQLALKKGDKIKFTYDYGDGNKFLVEIQDVKENETVHPEEAHYGHDTRAKLLTKGGSKMRKQYDDGDWENMYYRF